MSDEQKDEVGGGEIAIDFRSPFAAGLDVAVVPRSHGDVQLELGQQTIDLAAPLLVAARVR